MKAKNKILILALAGILLLPYAILRAQSSDETEQPTLISISITKENGFVPDQFEVEAGKTITIELTSDDNSVHGLTFSEKSLKDVSMGVNPGQTTSITFEVPKKIDSYSFYCSAPGHKRKGEVGTMIVVRPTLTDPAQIDENISATDLGIEEKKITSNNIFSPLNNLWNNIKIAFTSDPIKKTEMRLDIANEKLIEAKQLTEELNEPEKAMQAINAYQKEISKSIKIIEKMSETNQVKMQTFANEIIDNSFKQQNLIDGLEKKLNVEHFDDLYKAKEENIKYVNIVLAQIVPSEGIESTLIEIIDQQKGSEFKDFKNLEILKTIEEKAPEQAKPAIQRAQENTIQRLEENIRMMNEENKEEFKNYVKNIGGNEVLQLKVIENMSKRDINESVNNVVASIKENVINKVSNKIEILSEKSQNNLLNNLKTEKIEDLRIINELENGVSIQSKDRIMEVKEETLQKISKNIVENTDTAEGQEKFLKEMRDNNDVKQLEIIREIGNTVPSIKMNIIQEAKTETIRKIKENIAGAGNEEEKEKILNKIAGDRPEQIRVIEEIDDQSSSMIKDILQKQTEKIENKIQIIENTSTLEQLRERIQQGEEKDSNENISQIQNQIENRIKVIQGNEMTEKNSAEKPKKIEINVNSQALSNIKRSVNCIQVITPARDSVSNTCINFPTPCDVPSGWKKVESCVQADKIENINQLTCVELCGSLNYGKGICRSWAVVPSAKMGCRDDETKANATSDCFVPTNLMGLGKACCCSTPENKIVPHQQGEISNDSVTSSNEASFQINEQIIDF